MSILNGSRAVEMASAGNEIFGFSFWPDGKIHWQFLVKYVGKDFATLTTYSWWDGHEYSDERVDLDWLKSECDLYGNEEEWRDVGNSVIRQISKGGY